MMCELVSTSFDAQQHVQQAHDCEKSIAATDISFSRQHFLV